MSARDVVISGFEGPKNAIWILWHVQAMLYLDSALIMINEQWDLGVKYEK